MSSALCLNSGAKLRRIFVTTKFFYTCYLVIRFGILHSVTSSPIIYGTWVPTRVGLPFGTRLPLSCICWQYLKERRFAFEIWG